MTTHVPKTGKKLRNFFRKNKLIGSIVAVVAVCFAAASGGVAAAASLTPTSSQAAVYVMSGGGSDAPIPYELTTEGIRLPEGYVFPDGGHVNIRTSQGNFGVHFERLNQPPGSPKTIYIGQNFIPWSAFGLTGAFCVNWVQISLFNQHFGEGDQPPFCVRQPEEPTPDPTTDPEPSPTATPTPTGDPTPSPTPDPTTDPEPEPTTMPTATPTPTSTPTTTPSPTATPTAEPTPEPTVTPTAEPTPDPTTDPEPSPTATADPSPSDSPSTKPSDSPSTTPVATAVAGAKPLSPAHARAALAATGQDSEGLSQTGLVAAVLVVLGLFALAWHSAFVARHKRRSS